MAYLLPQLLTDTARRVPRNLAVDADTQSLTYEELDHLSNQLARALQDRGIEPGDRVGILAPKSAASIVALYAALKTGACYVPLDTGNPDERLALIIEDSGIALLLADQQNAERARALVTGGGRDGSVIIVDPREKSHGASEHPAVKHMDDDQSVPWDAVLAEPAGALAPIDAVDTDLAYMLYTSGSTGVPKGVMISHRASLSFVQWAASCAALADHDRVCSPAPLHFDLSVFDIFAACSAGACTVVLPPRVSMFPVRLAASIQDQRITVWYSVPSVLTLLANHGKLEDFDLSRLRIVIFAGEVFPAKHLALLMQQLPGARYLNWYGPTETNVCTSYEVPREAGALAAPLPIGRACGAAQVFAVSDGERITEPGNEGELYVAGPGLMSGYWGQPEKTSAALVPNPVPDSDDDPVYRSGDIVTLNRRGEYVFLGRRDAMVKTRGYRVELGEVETALYEHPAITEAVVLPVPDELLGNRLRAVVAAGGSLGRQELLAHCRRRLPAYMVPDVIEFSDALPKTSTGKVDRVLLQAAESMRPASGDA